MFSDLICVGQYLLPFQRFNTYFSGKDPVSYPLILLLSLFDGLATPPVLQRHTDLPFGTTIILASVSFNVIYSTDKYTRYFTLCECCVITSIATYCATCCKRTQQRGEQLSAIKTPAAEWRLCILRGRISIGWFGTTNVIENLQNHKKEYNKSVQVLCVNKKYLS